MGRVSRASLRANFIGSGGKFCTAHTRVVEISQPSNEPSHLVKRGCTDAHASDWHPPQPPGPELIVPGPSYPWWDPGI